MRRAVAQPLGHLLLSIANRLVAATAQRRTEIDALRLLGTTPRQVPAVVVTVVATAFLTVELPTRRVLRTS